MTVTRLLSSAMTERVLLPEMIDQFSLKSTTSLNVKSPVDRLVRDLHGRIIGVSHFEPGRNLLRRPVESEL
jgi:hypothetical protein